MLTANQQREYKENIIENAKAKFLLQFIMSNAMFPKIMNASIVKEV